MVKSGYIVSLMFVIIELWATHARGQSSISSPFDLRPGRVIQISGRDVTLAWTSTRKIKDGQQLYAMSDDLISIIGVIEVTQPPRPGDAPIAQGRIISDLKSANFVDKPLLAARDVEANKDLFVIPTAALERTLDQAPRFEFAAEMQSRISTYQRVVQMKKAMTYSQVDITLRGNKTGPLRPLGILARGSYGRNPLDNEFELREHQFSLGAQYLVETSLPWVSVIKLSVFPLSMAQISAGKSYHSEQRKIELAWEARYEFLKFYLSYSPPLTEKFSSGNESTVLFHDSLSLKIGSELPILRSGDKKSIILYGGLESLNSSVKSVNYKQNIKTFGLSLMFR